MWGKYEHELSAFDDLGLDDDVVDDALTYLLMFVQATARAAVDTQIARLDSALNDEQWWAANAPLLARVFNDASVVCGLRMSTIH